MARIIVSAAAAAVAFVVGGPAAAFQTFAITYGLTGFLDPNTKVLGTRLQDLKTPQANYGSPWPYVEGAPRLAGIYLWASNKREIATTTTQGKGGPGVDSTTFTYEMDCLIGISINELAAMRRIWSNGELVFSAATESDTSTAIASGGIFVDVANKFMSGGPTKNWRAIRFYGGPPDQLPDPVYEAAVGAGNAPAYRGRATIFIEGLNLGGSGQLPVLSFEVLSETTSTIGSAEISRVREGSSNTGGVPAMNLTAFDWLAGNNDGTYSVYRGEAGQPSTFVATFPIFGGGNATLTGNSDVSALFVPGGDGGTIIFSMLKNGGRLKYDVSSIADAAIGTGVVVCQKGGTVIFGGADGTMQNRLARFDTGGATPPIVYSDGTISNGFQSVAHDESTVYAYPFDEDAIYVFDAATLTLQATLPLPIADPEAGYVLLGEDATLYYCVPTDGGLPVSDVYRWDGATWSLFRSGLGDAIAQGLAGTDSYSVVNGVFMAHKNVYAGGDDYFGIVYAPMDRVEIVDPPLSDVVSRLCLRTGQLTADDFDVTALASLPVHAMPIAQVGTTRSALELLMPAYLFDMVENEKLEFVLRGGLPAKTIPFADLGTGADGTDEPLPKKNLDDIEIAAQVTVKYANILNDFQDGAETGDRLVTDSTAVSVVELALGLTPTEAKRLADANTMDLAVSLLQVGPLSLSRKHADLEPTDVVLVVAADGSTFRLRLVKGTIGAGIYSFDAALDDATAINSAGATDSDYSSSTLLRLLSSTSLEVLDTPILRDADDSPGIYIVAKSSAATGRWPGYELDRSLDGTTYTKVLDANVKAVFGLASTALGGFSGGDVFDEVNSLTVDVGGGELFSSTRDVMLDGVTNALLVGTRDATVQEVIQFRDAALLSPGVYLLTGFLRGRRGTEWAIGLHGTGERVVLLSTGSIRRVSDQQSDIGLDYDWKAITFGKNIASAAVVEAMDTGLALKPFSPVDLRVATNTVGDMQLTWIRRTRLSTGFLGSGIGVPLGEALEAYQVTVINTGTGLKVRESVVDEPSYEYSTSSQLADGISGSNPAEFVVRQISAIYGPGYPISATAAGGVTARAEIATITLGGTFQVGDQIYVRLGADDLTYTTTSGDANLAGVATSLAAALSGLPEAASAVAVGAVVTITGALSSPFVVQASLLGGAAIPVNTTQDAAPAGPGTFEQLQLGAFSTASGGFSTKSGDTFQVRFDRGPAPYTGDRWVTLSLFGATAAPAGWNRLQLMQAITGAPRVTSDGQPADIFFSFDPGSSGNATVVFDDYRLWSVSGISSNPDLAFTSAIQTAPVPPRAVDQAQISDLTIIASNVGAPVVGSVFRITIDGTDYDYVSLSGDTWQDVTTGMVAATTPSGITLSNESTAGPNQYQVIRAAANVANIAFTISGRIIAGTVDPAAVITQTAR